MISEVLSSSPSLFLYARDLFQPARASAPRLFSQPPRDSQHSFLHFRGDSFPLANCESLEDCEPELSSRVATTGRSRALQLTQRGDRNLPSTPSYSGMHLPSIPTRCIDPGFSSIAQLALSLFLEDGYWVEEILVRFMPRPDTVDLTQIESETRIRRGGG